MQRKNVRTSPLGQGRRGGRWLVSDRRSDQDKNDRKTKETRDENENESENDENTGVTARDDDSRKSYNTRRTPKAKPPPEHRRADISRSKSNAPSCSGPIGWFMPSLRVVSMSSRVAVPWMGEGLVFDIRKGRCWCWWCSSW